MAERLTESGGRRLLEDGTDARALEGAGTSVLIAHAGSSTMRPTALPIVYYVGARYGD